RRWISLAPGSGPTALYLSSMKAGDESIVDESVQIATIVPAPTVEASSKEIYMATTPRLVLNGTNFNLKNTELFFDPPLQEGTAIQKQILSPNQISLTKVFNSERSVTWTPEPGPLKLIAINTGPGRPRPPG
ncbi:unnamed protein product, partial [Hapterophycus canaliculatus]